MKLSFEFKGPAKFYGLIGYMDFTVSIFRQWRGDTRGINTWRHITLGLRSPLVRQPGRLFRDGRARWEWYPLRFGWTNQNLYLGVIYIVTTFGSSTGTMEYRKFGPFEWARETSYRPYRSANGGKGK